MLQSCDYLVITWPKEIITSGILVCVAAATSNVLGISESSSHCPLLVKFYMQTWVGKLRKQSKLPSMHTSQGRPRAMHATTGSFAPSTSETRSLPRLSIISFLCRLLHYIVFCNIAFRREPHKSQREDSLCRNVVLGAMGWGHRTSLNTVLGSSYLLIG